MFGMGVTTTFLLRFAGVAANPWMGSGAFLILEGYLLSVPLESSLSRIRGDGEGAIEATGLVSVKDILGVPEGACPVSWLSGAGVAFWTILCTSFGA